MSLSNTRATKAKNHERKLPKIAQLVAAAKTELNCLWNQYHGKRSDELLTMAREERNNSRTARPKKEAPGRRLRASGPLLQTDLQEPRGLKAVRRLDRFEFDLR